MAKHTEVEKRRAAMIADIRLAIADGRLAQGEKLVPLRDLAAQHGVSMNVTWEVIQHLINDGVLHTVPRIGTFVGKIPNQLDVYLFTYEFMTGAEGYIAQVLMGFEERIAELGGMSLGLLQHEAKEHQQAGQLPPLAGIFRLGDGDSWWPQNVPSVEFGAFENSTTNSDRVLFDDVEGGRSATKYLQSLGHSQIAFLALHSQSNEPTLHWSVDREKGWAQAMSEAGYDSKGLALHNLATDLVDGQKGINHLEQREIARTVAIEQVVPRRDITALVVANIFTAEALIQVLSESGLDEQQWPAILTFDDASTQSRAVVSYMRLPWDMIGRTAAQTLWDRQNGRSSGPPQQRLVPMRLIPRLTCHPKHADGFVALTLGYTNKQTREKVS